MPGHELWNFTAHQERTLRPYQITQKNGDASIPLERVKGLASSKLLAAGRILAVLMHVIVVKVRTLYRSHLRQAFSLFKNVKA